MVLEEGHLVISKRCKVRRVGAKKVYFTQLEKICPTLTFKSKRRQAHTILLD
jgi:hypothetical protein